MKQNSTFYRTSILRLAALMLVSSASLRPSAQAQPVAEPLSSTSSAPGPEPTAVPTSAPTTSASPVIQGEQILPLTLNQAVMMAIGNNRALKVEQYEILINEQIANREAARFDPIINGDANVGIDSAQRALGASNDLLAVVTYTDNARLGLAQTFPTGTQIGLEASTSHTDRQLQNRPLNQQISRVGLTFTQALLQGRDPAVNLAQIRQAELAAALSGYNLRGFAEALVEETELAFWNYLQARQQLTLTQASLDLIQRQLNETKARIEIGRLAGIEATILEGEFALRQQDLVTAQGNVERTRLALLRLINPDKAEWGRLRLELARPLGVAEVQLDTVDEHIQAAIQQRPEIQQTQIEIQRQELEVIRTRDGLLPRLDVFLTLGKSGYAESLWGSVANLPGSNFDFNTGVQLSYPLGARAAEADLKRAKLSQAQQEEALSNLQQLVELDVRRAYLEIEIARKQIEATRTARAVQEVRLQGEIERFNAGSTGSFPTAQAQRDLLAAQINEVNALMDYLKRVTSFYRFEGTLLKRRGISTQMLQG